MALIGFSYLCKHGLLTKEQQAQVEMFSLKMKTGSQEISKHFSVILEQPIELALIQIADIPQQLFPFSYR